MNEMLTRYWTDRTPRERWVLGGGLALLVVAFIYAYLWLPMARERERLMSELPKLRMQLQEMRADSGSIERLRANGKTAPADVKAALAIYSASEQGRRVTPQVNAEANGRLGVSLASVVATDWLAWIGGLSAQPGVRIEAVQIDALGAQGMVKASAILSSGN